jgi:hypothetical protein
MQFRIVLTMHPPAGSLEQPEELVKVINSKRELEPAMIEALRGLEEAEAWRPGRYVTFRISPMVQSRQEGISHAH